MLLLKWVVIHCIFEGLLNHCQTPISDICLNVGLLQLLRSAVQIRGNYISQFLYLDCFSFDIILVYQEDLVYANFVLLGTTVKSQFKENISLVYPKALQSSQQSYHRMAIRQYFQTLSLSAVTLGNSYHNIVNAEYTLQIDFLKCSS